MERNHNSSRSSCDDSVSSSASSESSQLLQKHLSKTDSTCSSSSGEQSSHQDNEEEYEDPYSDVRERMEELSRQDKVLHCCPPVDGRASEEVSIPFFAAITTYLGYAVLITVGHIRDICASLFRNGRYLATHKKKKKTGESDPMHSNSNNPEKYAPLLKSWENFYTRRLYHRIQDCFNRPIASNPGAVIDVLERVSVDGNKTMTILGEKDAVGNEHIQTKYVNGAHVTFCPRYNGTRSKQQEQEQEVTQQQQEEVTQPQPQDQNGGDDGGRIARKCLNLGSYNYLGFADDWQTSCRPAVMASLDNYPVSCSSSRSECGTTALHKQVETLIASYLGKEDAIVYNMGFNTNATTIPALMHKRDLLLSDELNHTSIVNGARASGADIRTFRHNDADHLEDILRQAIVMGQPRTRRPWNKIVVIVEGIYSMEGEYCNLKDIVRVCKRYKAYLYLDEAHSIGAMGLTGRGCCEYTGVDTKDVHLLMGTFTKSFGGMGGYIAGDRHVINYLRKNCAASAFHNSLSPIVCSQVLTSLKVIMGQDGTNTGKQKLTSLRDNSNYFRMRLTDMGLHILGNYDSPIMPMMLYNPTKIAAFSRECLKRGLAVVVVGFPAVPILMSRARFCISAGHTREQLDCALDQIDEIADILKLRYAISTFG